MREDVVNASVSFEVLPEGLIQVTVVGTNEALAECFSDQFLEEVLAELADLD